MHVGYSRIYESFEPGESMIVRRMPCVECDNGTVRYTQRRLCTKCYRRKAKRKGLGPLSTPEMFDLYVAKDWTDCWVWLGHISPEGYGKLRMQYTHRLSYERFVGPIPPGLHVDHLCRNRYCCKPEHLEPVTHAENIRRAARLITHCPRQHEYTPENTHITKQGGRVCRTCARERMRRSGSK